MLPWKWRPDPSNLNLLWKSFSIQTVIIHSIWNTWARGSGFLGKRKQDEHHDKLQDILSMASVYHKNSQRISNTRNHEGANTNLFPCKGIALTPKHWQFLIVHHNLLLMCVCWFSNHFSTPFAICCCINNSSKVGFARNKTPWWNPCKEKACCPGKESLVPQIAAQQKLDLHGDYSSVSIHSVTLTWYSSLILLHMHLQPNLKLIILNQHKIMKNIMLACMFACSSQEQ